MRRILVAVDEDEASERVVAFVNTFFGGLDVDVVAIHVGRVPAPWIPATAVPGAFYPWGLLPEDVQRPEIDRDALAHAEETIERLGLCDDDRVVELGHPADVIRRAAVDRDVDLIVVGSQHKGLLERMLGGSVSKELVDDAPRPVLVVH